MIKTMQSEPTTLIKYKKIKLRCPQCRHDTYTVIVDTYMRGCLLCRYMWAEDVEREP